jgi:hypothetical protein
MQLLGIEFLEAHQQQAGRDGHGCRPGKQLVGELGGQQPVLALADMAHLPPPGAKGQAVLVLRGGGQAGIVQAPGQQAPGRLAGAPRRGRHLQQRMARIGLDDLLPQQQFLGIGQQQVGRRRARRQQLFLPAAYQPARPGQQVRAGPHRRAAGECLPVVGLAQRRGQARIGRDQGGALVECLQQRLQCADAWFQDVPPSLTTGPGRPVEIKPASYHQCRGLLRMPPGPGIRNSASRGR